MHHWQRARFDGPSTLAAWRSSVLALILMAGACSKAQPPAEQGKINTLSQKLSQPAAEASVPAGSVLLRQTQQGVDVELSMAANFPSSARAQLLFVGEQVFSRSTYPPSGRMNTLIFKLSLEAYEGLPDGAPLTVRYGNPITGEAEPERGGSPRVWEFGLLDKGSLEVL